MATLSTLQTPIATKLVNEDGTINHVWNEFFVRLMKTAGITVSIDDLETETAELQTQIDSIGTELSASITITDSDNNPSSSLAVLYDGNKVSGGVEYTVSGTDKYIQYKYGIEDYVDRVGMWVNNANGRIYVGYSSDGLIWGYLKAETDHTLTSSGKFETATDQSDAASNYLQLVSGQNIAIFPNNIFAKYIRVYITGSYTTTFYEFIPSRILIAEMGTISNLAAISATFGAISGYSDIIDKPAELSDINSTEGSKLTGIETGADVTDYTATVAIQYTTNNPYLATSGHCTVTEYSAVKSSTSTAAWDSQCYSTVSYTDAVYCSFKFAANTTYVLAGINTDPTYDASYASLDYAWYGLNSGILRIYESGTSISAHGAYTSTTVLSIEYNGADVVYKKDGTTVRTVTVGAGKVFYFDSAMYSPRAGINDIKFVAEEALSYVVIPTVPYSVGQLWQDAANVRRCKVAKSSVQSYSAEDWEISATDDGYIRAGYTQIIGDTISVYSSTVTISGESSDRFDWIENSTTYAASITASSSYTPTSLAAEIQTKMRAVGNATTTVVYDNSTHKITIANSSLTTLSLLWSSGTNTNRTCGRVLGFNVAADDTGALSYISDNHIALRVKIGDLT